MARIRSLKPEFWTSEQIVDCSPTARLAFIGLWNFADDNGVHSASVRRLRAEVFPMDNVTDDDVASWIHELTVAGLIADYSVTGSRYWLVTGWERHQKIERPTYRHPLPDGTVSRMSDDIRRSIIEASAIHHRQIDDRSPPEWNGMESSKPPSHEGNSLSTLTTEIGRGWTDAIFLVDEGGVA